MAVLKKTNQLHPALPILCWVALALLIPVLSWQAEVLLAFFAAGLLWMIRRRAVGEVFWRLRWLSLAMWGCISWTVPGDPLWYAAWSPTWQGVAQASRQVVGLWALVWFLRALWLRLPSDDLLAGLLFLGKPLTWLHLPVERSVLRLRLTLDEVARLFEQPLPFRWESWRRALNDDDAAAVTAGRVLPLRHWRWVDSLLTGVCLLVLFVIWVAGR